jgi:putative transposase
VLADFRFIVCMSRPIRVDIKDGVYHVICRGTERCDLFRCDADYSHFIDRLAEAQRRFHLSVYCYVLMKTHFHLVVCTPEANLSQAMQWLKVSYSMWFNAKYNRVGPLFQGRFKGVLVDQDEGWLLDLSYYVHLNPVRIQKLGLGKGSKMAEALGWSAPSPEEAKARMKVLRTFRWSSYSYYAGYKRKVPDWLSVGPVQRMVRSAAEYRAGAEWKVSRGMGEDFLMKLQDRLALGSEAFVSRVRDMCSPEGDNEGIRAVRRRKSWHDVVVAVEKQRGVSLDEFSVVRGDWGKAAVFYFARKYAGMTLKEVGDAAGGVKYPAVSQLVKRFEKRMNEDRRLRRHVSEIDQMLKIQT